MFSLLLAFLGPLEGSAIEKVCRMSAVADTEIQKWWGAKVRRAMRVP